MCTLDLAYMEWDLRWLRREARKVVVLDYGVETKTEDEIRKETDDLVMQALTTAIRRYNPSYELKPLYIPEGVYSKLWSECYNHLRAKYGTEDVEEETKELIDQELERVYDLLVAERNRRLNELETNKEA
jgi:hypothetical protein